MANRFFTILIIPEKTSQVRRLILPAWLVRGSLIGLFFAVSIGTIMLLDYWYVMNQITENKELKLENRRLRQQVQVFKNKMTTVESTMERIKTFATRLKVITNIEDRGGILQTLNQKLPDATTNIGATTAKASQSPTPTDAPETFFTEARNESESPEDFLLRKEYEQLDVSFARIHQETMLVEQILQDQYELLADQKAFLAALPTRKPAVGYFTSGFGIRRSPYGGRDKMHEGLDIANHPDTMIRAPADGVVNFADMKPGYGQMLVLDHGYGLETWYGHARRLLVSKGQKVRRGDKIALLGNSGRSTGPHLHYEVRVHGTPVDPLSYILEN
jgi:murein DD-endopeptidase MepM/ murein hydrolase activator NlpD